MLQCSCKFTRVLQLVEKFRRLSTFLNELMWSVFWFKMCKNCQNVYFTHLYKSLCESFKRLNQCIYDLPLLWENNKLINHRTPLVRWSLHKYKYLSSVRGRDRDSNLQEGVSHTYTLRLGQNRILSYKKKMIKG